MGQYHEAEQSQLHNNKNEIKDKFLRMSLKGKQMQQM